MTLYFLALLKILWLAIELEHTRADSIGSKVGETIKIKFFSAGKNITVKGFRNESWTGEEYFSFRGIPYAEPPIGVLRFKDPKPLQELPSYIDARYDGYECPNIYAINASEDCLILNIYTPTTVDTASLPVLLFIHPGALYQRSSRSSFVGPAYLLSKPIVLVTFNYRLGTLGFLHLGTREIPGNAAFKDQVQALRWTKKYIQHFGGNPEDITFAGYSAGARSVPLHLVSPMSRGLFHKAIIMSGSIKTQTAVGQFHDLAILRKQARALNCTENFSEVEILNCLQQFTGEQIASTLRALFEFGPNNPVHIFQHVIEKDFGQERFLIEYPYESLKRGAFEKVPILIGFTNGEFCRLAVNIYKDAKLAAQFSEQFEKLAPIIFMYDQYKGNLSVVNKALKDYYLPNYVGLNEKNLARLCDFFSDAFIRFGAQRLAELAAPHTKVFPYSFEFRGAWSSLDYPIKPARVQHSDDYLYLFESTLGPAQHSKANAAIIRLYTKFVYDFVKKGALLAGKLPTYPTGYTKIDRSLEFLPGTFLAQDTYDLWKRLFI